MRASLLFGLWAASLVGCDGAAPVSMSVDAADVTAADDLAGDVSLDASLADDATSDAPTDGVADSGRVLGVRADRPGECPAAQPIQDTFDWAPTRWHRGACTDEEVETVQGLIATDTITEAELRRALSAECFSCAYSSRDDATWGALRLSGEFVSRWRLNEGGCLVAAGAPEACGHAYTNYQQCARAACDGCAPPDEDRCAFDPALFNVRAACQGYLVAYRRACSAIGSAYPTCIDETLTEWSDSVARVLRVMCGRPADGGV